MATQDRPTLFIAGVGEGFGASLAAAFAAAGYDIVGLARSDRVAAPVARLVGEAGGAYTHLRCDLSEPDALAAALQPHATRVAVLVHNAHELFIGPFAETGVTAFERVWRVACLGAAAVAGIVLPHMAARGAGTILLTGATASLRGAARFAAFASAKFALRGLAQSLAREYGSKGVHVAHIVLDGLIDEPQTERRFGTTLSSRMAPDALARAYVAIAAQHPSAWTHELDLRPFSERF